MDRAGLLKDFEEHFDGTLKDAFLAGMAAADNCPSFLLTKLFKRPTEAEPQEGQWCIVAFIDHLGWHLRNAQYLNPGWGIPNRHGMSENGSIVVYWAPMDYAGNGKEDEERKQHIAPVPED